MHFTRPLTAQILGVPILVPEFQSDPFLYGTRVMITPLIGTAQGWFFYHPLWGITPLCKNLFQEIYFTGVITKINPFFIIFMEISPHFEAEKVHLFRKNLVRAFGPLSHLRGGHLITKLVQIPFWLMWLKLYETVYAWNYLGHESHSLEIIHRWWMGNVHSPYRMHYIGHSFEIHHQ
jgi:hypothetical protein